MEQMDALKEFNLTKDGIESRVEECKEQVGTWKIELEGLRQTTTQGQTVDEKIKMKKITKNKKVEE